MSSQICLKWNSFLSNIATSFESLWEEEGLVDVTLASDGQCLTAHKVILSASSPFFKKVFQTNPCQHPVIILQDVHFSELEALLIFIYKGEVNIEQENLPALLKAAETLQIRGLSGGDIFAKEAHKKFNTRELQRDDTNDMINIADETSPKKKQKVSKAHQNHSILEKALTPRKSRLPSVSESSNSDRSTKDSDASGDLNTNRSDRPLEMKIEPFEVSVEELQKQAINNKEQLDRLDTGQNDKIQGTSKPCLSTTSQTTTSSIASSSLNNPGYSSTDSNYSSRINNQSPTSAAMRNSLIATTNCDELSQPPIDGINNNNNNTSYPPFPCPFCDRAYTSWGFRRRHIKAVHTISPELNCKWCMEILPTHAAWRRHVVSAHNLSASDAHNGLLILEEAHMVLQIAHPTRLDALVNIIKQNSSQSQQ